MPIKMPSKLITVDVSKLLAPEPSFHHTSIAARIDDGSVDFTKRRADQPDPRFQTQYMFTQTKLEIGMKVTTDSGWEGVIVAVTS